MVFLFGFSLYNETIWVNKHVDNIRGKTIAIYLAPRKVILPAKLPMTLTRFLLQSNKNLCNWALLNKVRSEKATGNI